jgi:predicted amidohydrolase
MKILIAQMSSYLGNVEKNLKKMVEIIESAIEAEKELVIFPELSLTGYLLEELVYEVAIEKVPNELLELSKKISIIFGAVEYGEDFYTYNTAYYLENGEVKHKHRKIYLPTYGMFAEGRYFKKGNKIQAFETKFGKIGMLICEDAWHQPSHYILAQDGAKYIFVLTCSPTRVSGEKVTISDGWNAILQSSALCNSIYTVMANRVGVEDGVTYWGGSVAFGPDGSKIKSGKYFEEQLLKVNLPMATIRRTRALSPNTKDENNELVLREIKRIKYEK